MLAVVVTLVVKEGQAEALRDAFRRLIAPTLAEEGCLLFAPAVDQEDTRRVVVYEQWVDLAALHAHRETPHYRSIVLEEIFPAVESHERRLLDPLD